MVMAIKRRRSSASSDAPISKRRHMIHPDDHISSLSSEILIRILHLLPIDTLLRCQVVSHRFYNVAGDSQIWKNLYYNRFVLPRALRIPGIKTSQRGLRDDALHFSSRRSKWLDEEILVSGKGGKSTDWKKQYKLRHNWSIGACEVQEIHVADRPSVPEMLVRLAEGVVVTADREEGLRAWSLKGKELIAKYVFEATLAPTCLAVDEREAGQNGLGIVVGFVSGGWGTWRLDVEGKTFTPVYRHASSNGTLCAVAYAHPFVLTLTDAQLLSLYTFDPKTPPIDLPSLEPTENQLDTSFGQQGVESVLHSLDAESHPSQLASLKSHMSWPPFSLSIRKTPSTLIASIAFSLPTYLSGYTVGLQELHLCLSTGLIKFSRLASSLPHGFSNIVSSPSVSATFGPVRETNHGLGMSTGNQCRVSNARPTTLSYAHPYILATHPDNTLTLYLCTSSSNTLSISPGTKLWGHTSSVSSAEIMPRGKAVSVSTKGNELRVWELEGGFGTASKNRTSTSKDPLERSVRVRTDARTDHDRDVLDHRPFASRKDMHDFGEEQEARKQWVGFDEEVVIVLKESRRGTQALIVHDFT